MHINVCLRLLPSANCATTMLIVSVLSAVTLIVAVIVLSTVPLTGSETIAEGFLGRNVRRVHRPTVGTVDHCECQLKII